MNHTVSHDSIIPGADQRAKDTVKPPFTAIRNRVKPTAHLCQRQTRMESELFPEVVLDSFTLRCRLVLLFRGRFFRCFESMFFRTLTLLAVQQLLG